MTDMMDQKRLLRERLKKQRREHVDALSDGLRALVFHRPPGAVSALSAPGTVIGLYHAAGPEAPALSYAKWYHENGYRLALPWFADRDAAMAFRAWHDPYDDAELEAGPFGVRQPRHESPLVEPELVFMPVVGFTAAGDRLGQGGGHYDRWLEAHPAVRRIGLAWDCQLVETLPTEAHDVRLDMIVTPTRAFETKQ